MKFKGDIIITDPCYLMKQIPWPNRDNFDTNEQYDLAIGEYHRLDDWEKCEYGDSMHVLGFTNYIVEPTMYGDWSCTTFDSYGKKLGNFCADAGLVGVFLLDEVLKYNPEYDDHIKNPRAVTLIKDFDGDVHIEYDPEEDEMTVLGHSTQLSFFTKQSGC